MATKIEKADFKFKFAGYGHYIVTYISPITQKEWKGTINCMPLIDAVLHEENPRKKDLIALKRAVKSFPF